MSKKKLIRKLNQGHYHNVSFSDFVSLLEAFGFHHVRTSGSHQIYQHNGIAELLNIQNVSGEVKPYQIKQFLKLVEKYNLSYE